MKAHWYALGCGLIVASAIAGEYFVPTPTPTVPANATPTPPTPPTPPADANPLTPVVTVVALAPVMPAEVPAEVPAETTISALSFDPGDKRCPDFESAFADYGLPVITFSYIAWKESRCTPSALNSTLNRDKSSDIGLLQINSTWKTVTSKICGTTWGDMSVLYAVDCNLRVAKYLYENGGLRHWRL